MLRDLPPPCGIRSLAGWPRHRRHDPAVPSALCWWQSASSCPRGCSGRNRSGDPGPPCLHPASCAKTDHVSGRRRRQREAAANCQSCPRTSVSHAHPAAGYYLRPLTARTPSVARKAACPKLLPATERTLHPSRPAAGNPVDLHSYTRPPFLGITCVRNPWPWPVNLLRIFVKSVGMSWRAVSLAQMRYGSPVVPCNYLETSPILWCREGSDSGMALIKNKLLKLSNAYVCQNTAYAVLERDTSPQVFETAPAPRGPSPRSLTP